jgi:hypothetical protein
MATPIEPGQPDRRSFFQRHPILLVPLLIAGLGLAAITSSGNDKGDNTGRHEYTKDNRGYGSRVGVRPSAEYRWRCWGRDS